MKSPLWTPTQSQLRNSQMAKFIAFVNQRFTLQFKNYRQLYQWSVQSPELFWKAVWDFMGIIATSSPTAIMTPKKRMQDTEWFTGALFNFAENLLKRRDLQVALISVTEQGDYRTLTYQALFNKVVALATYLRQLGVAVGDRVVGMVTNSEEAVVAMLATTSIGAVWSSCSPDFGLSGLVDRFSQITPKVLLAVTKHCYKGVAFVHSEKISALLSQLPSVQHLILIHNCDDDHQVITKKNVILYDDCFHEPPNEFNFESLPFNHPIYILYSSGTTGKPKCMVHGAGGTLIQHLKELRLHTDLTPADCIFFYTTCSWMMWNWLVSSLSVGSTVVLYDGSPFYPQSETLFNLIDKAKISIFGVGATYIESAMRFGLHPKATHSLQSLRTILSTGSPLLPKYFDYVYQEIKSDVYLGSISGGSDIISCFALGNPLLPVYRGEIPSIGLGMKVEIFDEMGVSITQEKGELVCTLPFPSMPIYFWNDPNGDIYQHAYFERFKGIWAHGDYAEITEHGGLIIYGRSDATINVRGIRIGTSEIYQSLKTIPEITDQLAIGQPWQDDVRIVLFVVLQPGIVLEETLKNRIRKTIRAETSAHHVPAKIIAVPELPRTHNDKLVELVVKKIINHEPITNLNAIKNPKVLAYFENLEELSR